MNNYPLDIVILTPGDIDLSHSPLRKQIDAETYVLGAFNPGMARLPNGNLVLFVRIAEALKEPIVDGKIHAIRWEKSSGYLLDAYRLEDVDTSDPRKFVLRAHMPNPVFALTSSSWLLPVEVSGDGSAVVKIHYEKIIVPRKEYQEYGVEDPRISTINGRYYMTTCSVSSQRHSTTLYSSDNGLDYQLEGIILDHQNKDMLLFEGTINNKFYALTRPLGSLYFATPPNSMFIPGPSINLAQSPDLLHWKPMDMPLIRPQKESEQLVRLGGGTQPILTPEGWLMLFHGVEKKGEVGIYRTYWALLDRDNPQHILHMDLKSPVLEAAPHLTKEMEEIKYIEDVIFTTGIVEMGDLYIIASGELDLCTRITHIPKSEFELHQQ